jgi:hypothetical protein
MFELERTSFSLENYFMAGDERGGDDDVWVGR